MKKSIKTIGTVAVMGIMLAGAYFLGTTQAETKTGVKTVAGTKETGKPVVVVPDGCIDTTSEEFYDNYIDMRQITAWSTTGHGLQLYLADGTGYYLEQN